MSIKSSAFGGVTLTGEDAKKFLNQVRYGRPKAAATASAKRGSAMLSQMQKSGSVSVTIKKSDAKTPGRKR
ncbi:hypothetical protein [Mesorhizobium jarvisii]|uniref:hypothetical protein n=1 Tax=Mesorhizobium jarvisii TaxID=1777867 RepID=UPI0011DDC797|nr:hypothetical protein [Mesorhizobium jarvisii]MCH4560360.1 hypothetical protein [Mesorhizobium jarvisii]QGU20880.1 hypothetical protein MCHK_10370 [Mesorhizobium huakuii 7653R]